VGAVEVERWVRVAPSWLGHRAEPLIHERMWCCPLELGGDQLADDGRLHEAGFDVAGRPVALRRSESEPGLERDEIETVEYREGEIVVNLPGQTVATTTIDDHGRPLRTVYGGGEAGEEIYHYDDAGRLAAIDEADCLWRTVSFYEMWDGTGGRLAVEHDEDGPLRVTHSLGGSRWERCDEPWQELLERGAGAIRDGVLRVVGDYCRARAVSPATEVFALMLTYVAQGSLYVSLSFGLEADRRRWLSAGLDPDQLAINLWYVNGDHEGLNYIEDDVIDTTLDSLLLREAALKQPHDPYRVVLNAAAAHLARHDWEPLLATTDDFIVYIAEHDEGVRPKHDSARAVNPPARLAIWDARWPPGVTRGEDEPLY
jgi:hypothetical protein